jgi:hydroxypyruvate isomerase
VLAGIAPAGADADKVCETFVSNIKFAANKLHAADIKLLIEAINTFDIPGFYVNGTQQTLDLIATSGSNNIFVRYDIYHMQRMEGELAATLKKQREKIAHVQLADNPGRNEPDTGGDQLPVPVPLAGRHRLQRVDRLRVQAKDRHR